jgi:hypothetical protein
MKKRKKAVKRRLRNDAGEERIGKDRERRDGK